MGGKSTEFTTNFRPFFEMRVRNLRELVTAERALEASLFTLENSAHRPAYHTVARNVSWKGRR